PAAGPQDQMAQNVVLAWLAGSRILELKTVQINDRLVIPRPCIDAVTVGYNVEWSQELRLAQSLREYVAGSMLVDVLKETNLLGQPSDVLKQETILDMSLGYDLAGIRSPEVRSWIESMKDARSEVEALRSQIPSELRRLRDLDFTTALSGQITLSTFHGCPAGEIEGIVRFLLTERRRWTASCTTCSATTRSARGRRTSPRTCSGSRPWRSPTGSPSSPARAGARSRSSSPTRWSSRTTGRSSRPPKR
ncbi:MAG: hypothetical protein DMF82_06950, partial [Acidobacteria bacterium]